MRSGALTCRSAITTDSAQTTPSTSYQYDRLRGKEVYLVSEQKAVDITSLWSDPDTAVVFWARSMGCFFCQELARELRTDVLPKLQAANIKAFLVTIGTAERGLEFAELTAYPADKLLADPENVTYDALQLKKGVVDTFFNIETPLAIKDRIVKDGAAGLRQAISSWKPWIPPGQGQSRQQGGCYIFKGSECIFEHKDKATGAHVDLNTVVQIATTAGAA
ncbi:probable peroxiredoxin-like 2C [Coccomyxa sp. Obi]|nr:probable peroxiredoxin-like 2C [Coccomyxa sp. Obi]